MSIERDIRTRISKIIDMSLKISNPSVERSEGKPDIFVTYAGHVRLLSILIYTNGWVCDTDADYQFSVYTTQPNIIETLDEILSFLKWFRDLRFGTNN